MKRIRFWAGAGLAAVGVSVMFGMLFVPADALIPGVLMGNDMPVFPEGIVGLFLAGCGWLVMASALRRGGDR